MRTDLAVPKLRIDQRVDALARIPSSGRYAGPGPLREVLAEMLSYPNPMTSSSSDSAQRGDARPLCSGPGSEDPGKATGSDRDMPLSRRMR